MPGRRAVIALLCSCLFWSLPAGALQTENLVLVTIDGLRWQEVFAGADISLLVNRRYVEDTVSLKEQFWTENPVTRRRILMPFMWRVIAKKGQLYGNRQHGNLVNVSNQQLVSYPGYSEILTGFADDERIRGNQRRYNPNVTVLEAIHRQPGFKGNVAVFGSWDLFPWIINERRSGIPVNAGFREATASPLSSRELFLNQLQRQVPSPWRHVRLDAFTHQYALEYLQKRRPRLLYIAYGETDDFAHDGAYDNYIYAARRSDAFIQEIWSWLQADPDYRDKTTLIVTTDHGRGSGRAWRDHGSNVRGSEAAWLAVLGPDTPALGELSSKSSIVQTQVAATIAALLGLEYRVPHTPGAAIQSILQAPSAP